MPDTLSGRESIKAWMKAEGVTQVGLAVLYDIPTSRLSNILSGKETGKTANLILMKIIQDNSIKPKNYQ